jgi:copper chaperone CopZ
VRAARLDRRHRRPSGAWIGLAALLALAGCGGRDAAPARSASPGLAPTASAIAATRVVTLEVGGMVCATCVAKVQGRLSEVPGVRDVRVSLADQRAEVRCDAEVPDTALTAAVRRAGADYVGWVVDR